MLKNSASIANKSTENRQCNPISPTNPNRILPSHRYSVRSTSNTPPSASIPDVRPRRALSPYPHSGLISSSAQSAVTSFQAMAPPSRTRRGGGHQPPMTWPKNPLCCSQPNRALPYFRQLTNLASPRSGGHYRLLPGLIPYFSHQPITSSSCREQFLVLHIAQRQGGFSQKS